MVMAVQYHVWSANYGSFVILLIVKMLLVNIKCLFIDDSYLSECKPVWTFIVILPLRYLTPLSKLIAQKETNIFELFLEFASIV